MTILLLPYCPCEKISLQHILLEFHEDSIVNLTYWRNLQKVEKKPHICRVAPAIRDLEDEMSLAVYEDRKCHQALDLSLPENVILLFQPPHCPEVNPIERLWSEIKKALKWEWYPKKDELRLGVQKALQDLNQTIITSVTGWKFIIEALVVAGI